MRSFASTSATLCLLAALSAGAFACAFGEFRPDDPFQRQYSLEQKHKRYTDLVRWSKFEEASGFVARDARKDYVGLMPEFDEVRFTDWEASPWQLDEEMRSTEIAVTYKGYAMNSLVEVKVHETQVWTRSGKGNEWNVVSTFTDLDKLAGN